MPVLFRSLPLFLLLPGVAAADRFPILDVARHKDPPVRVTAADLFDAMNTTDADNAGGTRGYVLVSAGAAP